jgi:2',3'-cyclic-nucleotide 2'-phosphodiesterase (5'-nucleotidase family)
MINSARILSGPVMLLRRLAGADRRFRKSGLLFLLLMLAGPGSCLAAEAGSGSTTARWPVCPQEAQSQTISFVHVADVHARYNPAPNGSSPLARVRGFVEQVRRENPFTVFTNAGDDYEKGSIAEELSRGQTTRQVVHLMQYDVRTLGNHDFAWGMEELLAFSHDPTALVVASNTKMTGGGEAGTPGWVDYAVLTVGCVRIGFFGLVSRPWNEKDEQYEGHFYPDRPELRSDFDYVGIAGEIIARHRREVDLLVLVSHLGLAEDMQLAERTEGIDLILGGHTHTVMTEPVRIKNTTIVHAGAYAERIGRFDLDFDLRDRRPIASRFVLADNLAGDTPVSAATDLQVKRIIGPYREAIQADFARLSAGQNRKNMALIAARAAVETLGADAALVSGRSAWKEWPSGNLTQQDVLDAFPVEREPAGKPGFTSLYLLRGTGADLLHAREALPDFAYWGPSGIDPAAVYTIAVQKPQALHQRHYFGREISLVAPDHGAELWQAVVAFGRGRSAARLFLDGETAPASGRDLVALLPPADRQAPPARRRN